MRIFFAVVALSALFLAGGCCSQPQEEHREYRLFFGRADGAGRTVVSEKDWETFYEREIIPAFPGGSTVVDASGAWKTGAGAIVREKSKLLVIIVPASVDERARLDEIRARYRKRFGQESVLLLESSVRASF